MIDWRHELAGIVFLCFMPKWNCLVIQWTVGNFLGEGNCWGIGGVLWAAGFMVIREMKWHLREKGSIYGLGRVWRK